MGKNNFWIDALKYGAILGAVAIVFDVLGVFKQNAVLSVGSLVAFILLAFYFTKRRVMIYGSGEEGYSYGRCLGYIVCMMLFAGLLEGIYSALAVNYLFPEHYEQALSLSLGMLENSGLYNGEQMQMMVNMVHSPVVLVLSGVFAAVLKGAFFGLFIAAFTKRDPNIFMEDNNE